MIPAKVNGVQVKSIDSDAFKNGTIEEEIIYYDDGFNEIESLDTTTATHSFVVPDYEPGTEALDITTMKYAVLYVDNEITAGLETQLTEMESQLGRDIPLYKTFNRDTEPELEAGQIKLYQIAEADGDVANLGGVFFSVTDDIRLTVSNLDLSKATYLEKIEDVAFSNVPVDATDVTTFNDYEVGLTSLTFGKNTNPIELGSKVFANSKFKELTTYASLYGLVDINNPSKAYAFGGTTVETLNVLPTPEETELKGYSRVPESIDDFQNVTWYDGVYVGMNIKNLNIGDGITLITYSTIPYFAESTIETMIVPASLTIDEKIGIKGATVTNLILSEGITEIAASGVGGSNTNITNLTIPSTVKTIGKDAFREAHIKNINFVDTEKLPSQLETIGDYAFIYNDFTDVVIPSSVKTIGKYGLYTYNIKTVTMKGRTSLDGMTLGDSWAGAATILYQ